MRKFKFYYDADGIKYKEPAKTCSKCKKYPCLVNFEMLDIDFAKYGCVNYEE